MEHDGTYQRINQKSDRAQQETASDKQRHFARIQREMKLQNAMQMQCKAYVTCVSCEIPHTHTHTHNTLQLLQPLAQSRLPRQKHVPLPPLCTKLFLPLQLEKQDRASKAGAFIRFCPISPFLPRLCRKQTTPQRYELR